MTPEIPDPIAEIIKQDANLNWIKTAAAPPAEDDLELPEEPVEPPDCWPMNPHTRAWRKYALCLLSLARKLKERLRVLESDVGFAKAIVDNKLKDAREEAERKLAEADIAIEAAFNRGLKAGNEQSVEQQKAIHALASKLAEAEQRAGKDREDAEKLRKELEQCRQSQ